MGDLKKKKNDEGTVTSGSEEAACEEQTISIFKQYLREFYDAQKGNKPEKDNEGE